MVKSIKEIEKELLNKRRNQLKKNLLQLCKSLRIKDLGATKINSISNKSEWVSALNRVEKEMVERGSKFPKTESQLPRIKDLIKQLKLKWNKVD